MSERRHESNDLGDHKVLDASDTLDGALGDDPLDRGVVTPDRWSAGMRFGSTAAEHEAGGSLDELLAEEEPNVAFDIDDEGPADIGWDENATDYAGLSALTVCGSTPLRRLGYLRVAD
jgi:hypothetical protein